MGRKLSSFPNPSSFLLLFSHLPNFTQNNAPLMKQLGRDLRLIADEFERSPERRRVLARAEAVHLEDISYDEFGAFLEELFTGDGGFSREQVVVMLFFCSDMVVKAYHNPLANFKRLFSWFLEFIMRKVCSWVKDHGGWVSGSILRFLMCVFRFLIFSPFWATQGVVLGQHVPAFSKTIFYLTGTVVLTILLLKKIL